MNSWKKIRAFISQAEAEIAKSLLEKNGIPARLQADDAGRMRPELAFSSGISLLVEESNVQEAMRVLPE
ncbi:MAG: hypothetical protein C5B49_05270 [Bdellovibrio sp.]|nr:MAG: hypothetical protein C5B49_05270 [Bdellovibrio sp.]